MKFKLHIEFGRRKVSAESRTIEKVWDCGEDIEFDPGLVSRPSSQWMNSLPGSLSRYKICERSLVRASLTVPSEWLDANEEFVLQVGMDPDGKIMFSRRSYDSGVMLGDDNGRSDILYDTMGPTLLSLIRVRTGKPLLVVQISVQPDLSREAVMRGVVDELTKIAPHVLSSASEWQNASAFELGRQIGAASYAAPDIEFYTISKLVGKMVPILLSISQAPACRVIKERRKTQIVWARKIPRSSAKKMALLFSDEGGTQESLPMQIDAYVCVRSSDVTAHRIIAGFLALLMVRLNRIFSLTCEQVEKYSAQIDGCELMCSQITHEGVRRRFRDVYKHQIESLRKHKQAAEDVLPELGRVMARLKGVMNLPLFKNVNLRDDLRLVPQDFEYDVRYRHCLFLMVDYENGHHWWKPLEDGRGWTYSLRALERGRYGNSLQRKYSILFEYWCCFRLLRAFESIGFNFANALKEIRLRLAKSIVIECEEGSFAPVGTFQDDNGDVLEVCIIHNYSAYSPNVNPAAQFKTAFGIRYKKDRWGAVQKDLSEKFLETPDMALVMRNKNTGKWFWFTMDAKSTDSLREHQVIKQNNYLSQLHVPEFDPESECLPWASWLVYAGSLHGVAGIENMRDEAVDLREWHPDDVANIEFYQGGQRNSGIECSIQEGLRLNKKSDRRFMGQIRVNPLTAPLQGGMEESSPFCDFAKMVIATARNNLR